MALLEADNFSVDLKGNSILKSLRFSVPEDSFFCVIGPNGAGKSVFVKCILGLMPFKGRLQIAGLPPSEVDSMALGYVPQIKSFDRRFPAQAWELVASGLGKSWPAFSSPNSRVKEALEQVHALHLLHRQISELSGGELQRIYLARSLAMKRQLFILDEPSTGIDAVGESDLYTLLDQLKIQHRSSILMVTHDIEVARHHSTHVLLLNHHQIAFGSPQQVLTHSNLEKAFGHAGHLHGAHA